jgi:lipid-A-disaccharide synthase
LKKIYIISGEASGDLHAANLVAELKKQNNSLEFRAWGGDRLRNEGVIIDKDIKELAFMGFLEVLLNIRTIFKNIRSCKENLLNFKPDLIILVDYPGFNLRIAKWAKSRGICVYYYISPQIWAWKESRIHRIKKTVERMYCILPFEKEFYMKHSLNVSYLGHPLLDEVNKFKLLNNNSLELENKRPILAILPGSRKQEIERKLPLMIAASSQFPEYTVIVACAPNLDLTYYEKFKTQEVLFVKNQTYNLLQNAELAIVTSGTATLEAALFKVPQVVCYKSSFISFFIAKKLIKIKFISLVNLIANKEIVRELIQQDCTASKIAGELIKIKKGEKKVFQMNKDYNDLIELLGNEGASSRVAEDMLKNLYLAK